MKEILLNVGSKEIRKALLNQGRLHNLIIERQNERHLTGNIYRGHVTNTLKNIHSAFINIGEEDNGFIHSSDLIHNIRKFEEIYEMDFDLDSEENEEGAEESTQEADIDDILKTDQPVLVQVIKEPIGSKGARLTSNISIAGRYLVLLPNAKHRGVSRKIGDRNTKERLKKMIRSFELPSEVGFICRTASMAASKEALFDEALQLIESWETIRQKFHKASKPTLLFEESDILRTTVLQALDQGYERILIDDYITFQECKKLQEIYGKDSNLRVEYYRDKVPIFERFNVEKEIERSLKPKIWLPTGGYLVLEKTEAMFTIDVNSGRSTAEGTPEETILHTNLEAAKEIARQLRIRNVGGLIICDFIDMHLRKNQKRVFEYLKECMQEDHVRCTVLPMSLFGLVEMTRQRTRGTLLQTMMQPCPYCASAGYIKSYETTALDIERALKKAILCKQQYSLKIITHPEVDRHLTYYDKDFLRSFAEKENAKVIFDADDSLHLNHFSIYSTLNNKKIDV